MVVLYLVFEKSLFNRRGLGRVVKSRTVPWYSLPSTSSELILYIYLVPSSSPVSCEVYGASIGDVGISFTAPKSVDLP